MIKNMFFCITKTKVDHPESKFWIILLGTDRLEVSFSIYQTMIGNDANTDILQLSNCISSVTEVTDILAEHPEWDRGPQCLKLPSFYENDTMSAKADHINPTSWTGDICASQVLLITSWNEGHWLVKDTIRRPDNCEVFSTLQVKGIDVLFPLGNNHDDDESVLAVEDADNDNHKDDTLSPAPLPSINDDLDLKDQVTSEEAMANTLSFKPFIEVNRKPMYKAHILQEYFKYKTNAGSMDCLKCIAGLS